MIIALYTRYLEESARHHFNQLVEILQKYQIEYDEVSDPLPQRHYDFLFSIGGDGTLLSSVHLLGNRTVLTTAGRNDLDSLVADLTAHRYTLEPRTLLHVVASHSDNQLVSSALNEVSLHRLDDDTILRTDLYVDSDFVATYSGDGLIVATPTGSTAYSLSCGGPILTPNCGCFVITPIAAHNLTLRPIIVPDTASLRLVTHPKPQLFNLGMDSRRQHLACGTEISISRQDFTISLVRLNNQNFFTAIHHKLGWNFS